MDRKSLKEIKSILETLDTEESQRLVKKLEKELKPISVSSRKAKGRNLQQYVAQKLSEKTGIPYGQDELIQSRPMGCAGVDVPLIGEAKEKIPFDIECKSTESISVYSYIEQAEANTAEGRHWLVVHKKKNHKPIAVLDFDVLMDLLF